MNSIDWHIHRGDPCTICGCEFRERDADPDSERRKELALKIEDAEGEVAGLEAELEWARDRLSDLEGELSRMDKADRHELERMQRHPWMLARGTEEAVPA